MDPQRPPIARLRPGGSRGVPSRTLRRSLLQSSAGRKPGRGEVRPVREWHTLDAAERLEAWSALVDFAVWLHDRYELSVEERLPPCWPQHPGLIEELAALQVWRAEIYTGEAGQPTGQAARYWHAELRALLTNAVTVYAAGCRAAHRDAETLDAIDPGRRDRWLAADPLAGIPLHRVTPHRTAAVTGGGPAMSGRDMRRALAAHHAAPLSETVPEIVHYRSTWWITDTPPADIDAAESTGVWRAVTDPTAAADLDRAAARMALADAAVRRRAVFTTDPGARSTR